MTCKILPNVNIYSSGMDFTKADERKHIPQYKVNTKNKERVSVLNEKSKNNPKRSRHK